MYVEKRKSTAEIQAIEVIEEGITQHEEEFQVIVLRTRTDPSLLSMRKRVVLLQSKPGTDSEILSSWGPLKTCKSIKMLIFPTIAWKSKCS